MKYTLLLTALLASFAAGAQSKEQLLGCWKMPSRAGENLQLNRDGSFIFNDYNATTNQIENMYGTWQQSGAKVSLLYDDRPKQTFSVVKDKSGKWTLTKAGGFRFVKGTPADCMQ